LKGKYIFCAEFDISVHLLIIEYGEIQFHDVLHTARHLPTNTTGSNYCVTAVIARIMSQKNIATDDQSLARLVIIVRNYTSLSDVHLNDP
jgi:hypothetical protein